MTRTRVLVLFCFLPLIAAVLKAQAPPATGLPPFSAVQNGGAEAIDLGNLNSHFSIPIFSRAGRGTDLNLGLTYDSLVLSPVSFSGLYKLQPAALWGWESQSATLAGTALYWEYSANCLYGGTRYDFDRFVYYAYVDKGGTYHPFPHLTTSDSTAAPCTTYPKTSASASDGSGYVMTVVSGPSAPSVGLQSPGGDNITPAAGLGTGSVSDSNGNVMSSSGFSAVDTIGTAVTISGNYTPFATTPTTYTYTGPAGESESVTVNVAQFSIRTNFQCPNVSDYSSQVGQGGLITSIVMPDGSQYAFSYEATPGYPGSVTGRIASITLPSGGTTTYQYSGGTNGINCADGSPATLTRTTPDGTWIYSHSVSGSVGAVTGSSTTVTDPQGNQTVLSFAYDSSSLTTGTFVETQRLVYQGSSSGGTLLLTKYNCYNGNLTNCPTAAVSSPITQKDSYTQPTGIAASHTETLYNLSGSVTDEKDYDYNGGLVREVANTYNTTLTNNILNRPSQVTIKNGSGIVLAQTNYSYDETAVTATSGTPQHNSVSGSRGNLTTLSTLVSGSTYLAKHFQYFDTGLVQTATDVNGTQATNAYGACGNSLLTSTSSGGLTQGMTWDCTGGRPTSKIDANNQTTTYSYKTSAGTPDPLWRALQITDPLSNITTYTYTAANGSTPASQEQALTFNSGASTSDVLTTFDSSGRIALTQKRQSPSSATFDTVSRTYNSIGYLSSVSMPCAASAGLGCSTPKTTYTYDALGRTTQVKDGGGGYSSLSYSSNDVLQTNGPAPTGENTKRKQLEYDGLGRLASVCEITSGSGSGTCAQSSTQTGYWTTYVYDALGNLTGVTQNAQGTAQTRSFSYDGMSRLTSETNPESGAKTYTYDSIPMSPCNNAAQTFNGDLVRTVDANGTYTCFFYDGLHRLTDVGTNRATDGCKRFRYDNSAGVLGAQPSGVHTSNSLGRLVEAETDTCAWPITSSSIVTDEWSSYSARGELTDVWESTPHSGSYYHPTAAYWATGSLQNLWISTLPSVSYNVDGEGRTSTVSASSGQNPVTSTSYNVSSQVTGVTLGSGDTDSFAYDPNTGRITQYKYTINGSSEVGNLTWNTNGSLKTLAITDPFNAGDAQTCNYAQDDLARISSVNCGSPWSQTFTYDPFGNVTKSGSISWQPGYSSSTNRYTLAGTSYDANGNLLKDSFHTYTVDVNGRPLTIDSIGLIYDAFGRMVEQNQAGTYYQIVYDPLGRKLGIFKGATVQQFYVPLPGGTTAEYLSWGLSHYRHTDWLGSDRLETGASDHSIKDNNAYAPFGEPYAQIGNGEISFTGQNKDTTWLQYDFMARQYDPKQGRWIVPDPIGISAANATNPQSWNRYAYVLNSPLNFVDPYGLLLEGPGNQSEDLVFCGSCPPTPPTLPFAPSPFPDLPAVSAVMPNLAPQQGGGASSIGLEQPGIFTTAITGMFGASARGFQSWLSGTRFEQAFLNASGLAKNEANIGGTVPDILATTEEGLVAGIGEVKSGLGVFNTGNVRTQIQLAQALRVPYTLIVNTGTHVSATVRQAISQSGGALLRFDAATGALEEEIGSAAEALAPYAEEAEPALVVLPFLLF